jgi:hypothetical protein
MGWAEQAIVFLAWLCWGLVCNWVLADLEREGGDQMHERGYTKDAIRQRLSELEWSRPIWCALWPLTFLVLGLIYVAAAIHRLRKRA